MGWIEFTGKCFLAGTILAIQLLSVRTINRLITNLPGLKLQKKVIRESTFVFVFFAIQVTFESGLNLALDTYSKETVEGYTPSKAFLETIFCGVGVLYFASYVVFIIILQQYWAFTHQSNYICPIL